MEMDDFVVIGENEVNDFVEEGVAEPIVLRFDIPLILLTAQDYMVLMSPGRVDLSVEWQRVTSQQFYWINRFNLQCGCLLDNSCTEPHACYQKMWSERLRQHVT